MELVVETSYVVDLVAVCTFRDTVVTELCDVAVDPVTVVREILESVDLVGQAVAECLVEVDIRFVRVLCVLNEP